MAGYGGLVSLGQSAFFGIGAYTTAVLYSNYGMSPWLGLVAGVVLTTATAVLISWPCFRLRGAFFSLATMVFPIVHGNRRQQLGKRHARLQRDRDAVQAGHLQLHVRSRWAYLVAAFALMMMVYGITRWMHRGRLGLYLIAMRDDQAAAESMGVEPVKVKLLVTMISAALTASAASCMPSTSSSWTRPACSRSTFRCRSRSSASSAASARRWGPSSVR